MALSTYRNRQNETPLRRRVSGLALALAIEILLILAFLTLDFRPEGPPEFQGGRLTTFDVAAEQEAATKSVQKQAEAERQRPRPILPPIKPRLQLPERPLPMLIVSKEVYEASDISKLGSNAPGASAELAGGGSPGDSERVGTAPNGQPLYAAEWYREPTHTELGGYLPKNMPESGGWGLIACKTAPRFRVTDCVELGQEPAGSHLAGAVRQAAWQFLVRPPRKGGKSLVGEWVRIRVDNIQGRNELRVR